MDTKRRVTAVAKKRSSGKIDLVPKVITNNEGRKILTLAVYNAENTDWSGVPITVGNYGNVENAIEVAMGKVPLKSRNAQETKQLSSSVSSAEIKDHRRKSGRGRSKAQNMRRNRSGVAGSVSTKNGGNKKKTVKKRTLKLRKRERKLKT